MDKQFLRLYEDELSFIRHMGESFAREYPKVASRLGLRDFACADPYVERLLEGFAFLTARVHRRLDAEFPRFTQALLNTVHPDYLAPTPSIAIVRFAPLPKADGLADGMELPRDTVLRSKTSQDDRVACTFRTAHPVTLWPLQLTEAEYHIRDRGALGLPDRLSCKAVLRLRIESTDGVPLSALPMDELPIHIPFGDNTAMRLYEQLFANTTNVLIQSTGKDSPSWQVRLGDGQTIEQVGFSNDEALFRVDPRVFQGYRLLREYFAAPDRFMFFRLTGLRAALAQATGTTADIMVLLDADDHALEGIVNKDRFALYCTPAINLFPRTADRIHVSPRFSEFQVIPDRTRLLDYEVHRIERVVGYGSRAENIREFRPFYAMRDIDTSNEAGAYFTVNRTPRRLTSREQRTGPRSEYLGTDVSISIVDSDAAPYAPDLRELGVEVWCTNRDVPRRIPLGDDWDFSLDISLEATAHCMGRPSAPTDSFVEGGLEWRVISHLSLNYLSLVDTDSRSGASALRELLTLYCGQTVSHFRRQVEGVRSITTQPISRRMTSSGHLSFIRGLEIALDFDESSFRGSGCFLLGAVLEHFLAGYVSVNSFTETVIRSTERGEIKRWPMRSGNRPLL